MERTEAKGAGLGEIAAVFGRIGLLGFGGPIAAVAMMEETAVRERKWLSAERFTEIYAVCKLLPGPISTQVAIYIGRMLAGAPGGILAGVVFVAPAFLLVLALSALYARSGAAVGGSALMEGLQAGALALIVMAAIQLARPYRREGRAWAIGLLSMLSVIASPRWEAVVILFWGLVGAYVTGRRAAAPASSPSPKTPMTHALAPLAALAPGASAGKLGQIFWVCLKAGAFTFGSGLAIVPLLEADAVSRHGWLTHSQFMDGLAIGQITPGPVVITSTFIGYQAAGLAGALVATAGMFFPAFVNVIVILPRIWERLRGSPGAKGFTAWAIPAVVGGIAGASVRLGSLTLTEWRSAVVFMVALAAVLRYRVPSWALVPAAGVLAWGLGFLA